MSLARENASIRAEPAEGEEESPVVDVTEGEEVAGGAEERPGGEDGGDTAERPEPVEIGEVATAVRGREVFAEVDGRGGGGAADADAGEDAEHDRGVEAPCDGGEAGGDGVHDDHQLEGADAATLVREDAAEPAADDHADDARAPEEPRGGAGEPPRLAHLGECEGDEEDLHRAERPRRPRHREEHPVGRAQGYAFEGVTHRDWRAHLSRRSRRRRPRSRPGSRGR